MLFLFHDYLFKLLFLLLDIIGLGIIIASQGKIVANFSFKLFVHIGSLTIMS